MSDAAAEWFDKRAARQLWLKWLARYHTASSTSTRLPESVRTGTCRITGRACHRFPEPTKAAGVPDPGRTKAERSLAIRHKPARRLVAPGCRAAAVSIATPIPPERRPPAPAALASLEPRSSLRRTRQVSCDAGQFRAWPRG